jgi:hypothetical protein
MAHRKPAAITIDRTKVRHVRETPPHQDLGNLTRFIRPVTGEPISQEFRVWDAKTQTWET